MSPKTISSPAANVKFATIRSLDPLALAFLTLLLLTLGWSGLSVCFAQNAASDQRPIEDLDLAVGLHPDRISGWNGNPYFCDFLKIDSRNWLIHGANDWTGLIQELNPKLINRDGYPITMPSGTYVNAKGETVNVPDGGYLFTNPGQGGDSAARATYKGRYVLQWKGEADIRATNGMEYLSGDSETGVVRDGKRIYQTQGESIPNGVRVEIRALGDTPITGIRLSMPDPHDPWNQSLEEGLFHPTFLQRIADTDWAYIRMMTLIHANGNPQQDWSDRRRPNHCFQEGVINTRTPAPADYVIYDDKKGNVYRPTKNRETGMSFEYMVELCNVSNTDLWLSTPHLLTPDATDKLARLIAFGSDGADPYEGPTANPVYPPLKPELNVYVEFSNEIWQWPNDVFAQTIWAKVEADKLGISVPAFNARQFSKLWSTFEKHMPADRVVRVGAIWATSGSPTSYTGKFVAELYGNSSLLKPEILSPATYFGNDIQQWVFEQKTDLPGDPKDAYWTSSQFDDDVNEMFDVWTHLMFTGKGYGGLSQRDTVSQRGGFDVAIHDLAKEKGIYVVAYEGGPSIYTDKMNSSGTEDDGITIFMNHVNRHPRFIDLYRLHMHQGLERGVESHSMFTMSGKWSKYGQWGHLEYLLQDPKDSPKYTFLKEWSEFANRLNNVDTPVGSVPQFVTEGLPIFEIAKQESLKIETAEGDGATEVVEVLSILPEGLKFDLASMTILGTPTDIGNGYVYLMARDADGDAVWKTYQATVIAKGSYGPTMTLDFEKQAVGTLASGVYTDASGYTVEDTGNDHSHKDLDVLGPADGFQSNIIENHTWSRGIDVKYPGGYFHLKSFEYAGCQWKGESPVEVTAFFINGETTTLSLTSSKKEMTKQVVNWNDLERVEFRYAKSFGALDNFEFSAEKNQ